MSIKPHEIVLVATMFAFLGLYGCGSAENTKQDETRNRFYSAQEVQLVTTSPDGTKLWRVYDPITNRTVFFSSGGTQTSEGKSGEAIVPHVDHPSIVIR